MSIHEPGEANTPEDEQGDGPVTLSDRTEPGGQGSPGSNQAKDETVLDAPDLDSMNVGSTDPQAPRHPGALRSSTSDSGAYAHEAPGPDQPVQLSTGTAHRAPGLQGETPVGESVTTDTAAGAARMGPAALDSTAPDGPGQGDDASVPSSGTAPLEGSSQEHQVVSGIKLPQED